ncbi:replication region DNA-binding N-term [Amphritea atlantica]|uniref:Replication region DNA-binding N-term n=1 Tax=Amphritea atlantica TaxID=355243 RepID=A0A1H9ILP3_9GAMM|nr:DNA-binding protein [Amphritea atlantica]SEQ75305.1 replication region DNA-binding N-term [Amphritea atlantica]
MTMTPKTYDKVFEIADNLLAEGRKPTQQMVRNELGVGSLTTINKALNDWWQGLGKRLIELNARPDIPEPVFNSANTLWQQALAYAEHQLSDQREQLEQRYLALKAELEGRNTESHNDLRRLQDLSDKLLSENQQSLAAIAELQKKQLAQDEREMRLESENRDLRRQIKEFEITLEQLERSGGGNHQQEVLEYPHKNQYLEGETSRLEKHNQVLQDENRQLRDALLDVERQSFKEKHQLEQVISQQDMRYREMEQKLNSGSVDSLLEVRLQEKEREVERLHSLLENIKLKS